LVALFAMVQSGEMPRHVVASLFRVGCGFTLAVLLGVPFGLALGSFAWLSGLTNAVIQCLRPISPIAWLPVATLTLGGGDWAAIFLIFLAAFFPIAVSTAAAVAGVDLRYRRSALNFGVRGFALARDVIFPATLPSILTALRIGLGIAWVVVVAAEMLGVESGLGFLVLDARNQLRYDRVVAAMIMIGVIGLGLDFVVRRLERSELERRGLVAR
jgi:NitT/TauT family transport system permease protein